MNFLKSFSDKAKLSPPLTLVFVFIQQPHHAGLAVIRRHHADTEVELLAARRNLDPPVLATPPFGNVHFCQNLDAGEQGP